MVTGKRSGHSLVRLPTGNYPHARVGEIKGRGYGRGEDNCRDLIKIKRSPSSSAEGQAKSEMITGKGRPNPPGGNPGRKRRNQVTWQISKDDIHTHIHTRSQEGKVKAGR